MKITWKCKKCRQKLTSDTSERHKMDWCKCGKSAVDAEKHYIRVVGDAEIILEKKKSSSHEKGGKKQ